MTTRDVLDDAMHQENVDDALRALTDGGVWMADVDTMTQAIHDVYCGIMADHAEPNEKDREQARQLIAAIGKAEMIRGKRLRALAVIGDKSVDLDGYGTIEPLTKFVPNFKAPANYFGIFIPKSVPPEVIATVEKIWNDQIKNSATLK